MSSTKLKIGVVVIGFGLMSIGLLVQRDQIHRLKAESDRAQHAATSGAGESATAEQELIAHESDRAELLGLREEIARLRSSASDPKTHESQPATAIHKTTNDSATNGFEPMSGPYTRSLVDRSGTRVNLGFSFFIVPDQVLPSIGLGELLVGQQTILSADQVRDAIARIHETSGVTRMAPSIRRTLNGLGLTARAGQGSEPSGFRVVSEPSVDLIPEASGEGVFRVVYLVRWETNQPVSTPPTNGPVPVPEVSTMPSPTEVSLRDGDTLVTRAWVPVGSSEPYTGTSSFLAFITIVEVDGVGVRVRNP
jgi:hypothetical protein